MNELFGVIPMKPLALGMALTLLVVLVAITASALRNRVFLKLALRNIPRRPAQTALIVVGLMLSTMIIAASLGVGDTITNSIRSFVVVDGLGHTDEVVRSPTLAFLGDDYLDQSDLELVQAATDGDDRIDGVMALITERLPITSPRSGRTEARADIRGFDVNAAGWFGELKSTDGATVTLRELAPGEIYVNVDTAKNLDAVAGDDVIIVTPTGRHDFVVRAVLERGGLASTDPRVLMGLPEMQRIMDRAGQFNRVDISNRGGVLDGLDLSDDVTDDLRLKFLRPDIADQLFDVLKGDEIADAIDHRLETAEISGGLADDLGELAGELRKPDRSDRFAVLMADDGVAVAVMAGLEEAGFQQQAGQALPLVLELPVLRVTDIKAFLVEIAELVGTIFTLFFMVFGSFSIIVGLLLIFLVFVMLAGAREQEMGMARAIGTKRGHLVRLFTFEGSAYALLAGLAGTLMGIAAAFLLVTIMNSIFAEEGSAFSVRPSISTASIVVAFCAGVLLTLATVAVSAYRVSKLTIVTAIRGLPEEFVRPRTLPLSRRLADGGWALVTPARLVYEEMMARGWGDRRTINRVGLYATAIFVIGAPIWLWWIVRPLFEFLPIVPVHRVARRGPIRLDKWGEPRKVWKLIVLIGFFWAVWIWRIVNSLWQLVAPYNRFGIPALVVGLLMAIWGINIVQAAPWTIGASLFLIGVGQAVGWSLRRSGRLRARASQVSYTISAGLVLIFWSLPFDALNWLTGELDSNFEMFILSGVFMVGSAVFIVMNNAETLSTIFERGLGSFGSMKPVIRTSIAYPLAAKFRTGLTIAMFSLVIFTLIVFAILNSIGSVLEEEPDRVTGGYDIRGTTSRDLPITDVDAAIAASPEISASDFEVISRTGQIRGEARQNDAEEIAFKPIVIRGLDDEYLQTSVIEFTHWDHAFGATDAEIWDALRNDPSLAVMNGQVITPPGGFAGPQADQFKVEGITTENEEDIESITVQIRAPGGRGEVVERKIIAYMDNLANVLDSSGEEFSDGNAVATVLSAAPLLQDVAGIPVPFTIYQFRLTDPARADEIAGKLETVFLDNSMEADSAQFLIKQNQEQGDAFNLLFQGFMGLGLLVGVASLGVISFRAVVERRQSIGMMRAIGYKGWMIQAGFLMESTVIALLGIAIGIGLGSMISYNIVQEIGKDIEGLKFHVPWMNMLGIVGIAWAFAMITTYWPARQASRIYPSEALRYE
ncbi:MAG: FtsX-like permease family protein [Chloroflexi bacterium]|nr:FtsX-like permease family protein [Chloroflexota bacterium]